MIRFNKLVTTNAIFRDRCRRGAGERRGSGGLGPGRAQPARQRRRLRRAPRRPACSIYGQLSVRVPVGQAFAGRKGVVGDCRDRYIVRLLEIQESVRLCRDAEGCRPRRRRPTIRPAAGRPRSARSSASRPRARCTAAPRAARRDGLLPRQRRHQDPVTACACAPARSAAGHLPPRDEGHLPRRRDRRDRVVRRGGARDRPMTLGTPVDTFARWLSGAAGGVGACAGDPAAVGRAGAGGDLPARGPRPDHRAQGGRGDAAPRGSQRRRPRRTAALLVPRAVVLPAARAPGPGVRRVLPAAGRGRDCCA